MDLAVYHGTNLENALSIQKNGFSFEIDSEHWLGNGCYFYFDYALAKWWTSKPSKKYGSKGVYHPVVLCCRIEIDEEDLLDLQRFDDYKIFVTEYTNEYLPKYIKGIKPYPRKKDHTVNYKVLRCRYCEYLQERFCLKAISGNFYLPEQPYLPEPSKSIISQFQLAYTEIQLCVFDPQIIKIDAIVDLLTGKEVCE